MYSDFNVPNPSSIMEFWKIEIKTIIFRFTSSAPASIVPNQDARVIWNNEIYNCIPLEANGFEDGEEFPRPKLRISNVGGIIRGILDRNGVHDLAGGNAIRIRTLLKYLDDANWGDSGNPSGLADPNVELPQQKWRIERLINENSEFMEWELNTALDLANLTLPHRTFRRLLCPYKYKGEGCGYSGTNYWDLNDVPVNDESKDRCSHTLKACQLRFPNQSLPFGGFPGLAP